MPYFLLVEQQPLLEARRSTCSQATQLLLKSVGARCNRTLAAVNAMMLVEELGTMLSLSRGFS